MGTKLFKYAVYSLICCLAVFFVLDSQGKGEIVDIIKIVCIALGGVCILFLLVTFIVTTIENKKIKDLSDNDKYEELIKFGKERASKKFLLFNERRQYYYYLILLGSFALNDKDDIEKYYELLTDKNMFPFVCYWKGCYEVANGNNEGIKEFDLFVNNPSVIKNKNLDSYQNIFVVIEAITNYANGNIELAKEKANLVNVERLSMISSKKCMQMIKNA